MIKHQYFKFSFVYSHFLDGKKKKKAQMKSEFSLVKKKKQ